MLIKLEGVKSAEQAIEMSGLSWGIDQLPLIAGNGVSIDTHKALFRNDSNALLGVVGKDYYPIPNSMAFSFFDVICDRYNCTYQYAGVIKEGRKIFLQAKMGKSFEAAPGDRIEMFLTLLLRQLNIVKPHMLLPDV
jgi:hypothetical protein